jgi:hypothetical protein
LKSRTESWVVGLQLAALSLKGQPSSDDFIEEFSGGHQFILDYLTEEVLDPLPEAQRDFLLRTSILERFSSPLCEAVTGDPSSQRLLEEIRRQNLFLIPLDVDGRWFRYQHLFAEVLNTLLERDHPEEISTLHLKAAVFVAPLFSSSSPLTKSIRWLFVLYALLSFGSVVSFTGNILIPTGPIAWGPVLLALSILLAVYFNKQD